MKTALFATFVVLGLTASMEAQTLSSYQSTVLSQSPSAYYKLDGTLTDSVGGNPALTINGATGSFMPDVFHNITNGYGFLNGADALVEANDIIPGGDVATNAAATGVGSITMLFRALDGLTTGGQRFVFSAGNSTTNGNALGLFFENSTSGSEPLSLKLRVGDTTTPILTSNSIAFNSWYYIAITWDEARDVGEVKWVLGKVGGTLTSGTIDIANEAVVGENGPLYLGNQASLGSALRSPGRGRVDEFAVFTNELSFTQISNQFSKLPAALSPTAPYQDVVTAQFPAYYFKLDNSLTDAVGGTLTLSTNGTTGAFTTNVLGTENAAYAFSGTNDTLWITNDIVSGGGTAANANASAVGSLTFLFRMLSDTNNSGQRFLLGQGTVSPTRLNLFLENTNEANGDPNSLKMRIGNATTTVITNRDLVANAWYFLALTWDETRNNDEVHWFWGQVGGTLTNGIYNPANDSLVGDNGPVTIGGRSNVADNVSFRNPGSGAIDEFATYNDELNPQEIAAQFSAITNVVSTGPAPTLTITRSGSDALISWPVTTSPSYALESATNLTTSPWTSAGTPTVIGPNNVVTNATSGSEKYFRLHKP